MITVHGYGLDRIHQLARSTASSNYAAVADYRDLHAAAHGAMIDLLLAADQPPTELDLRYAGGDGIRDLIRAQRQTYGYRNREADNGVASAPRFNAYWSDWLTVTPSHETKVTERIALFQILYQMNPTYRAALIALAVCDGDRGAAAAALRLRRGTFDLRLNIARQRAARLWHQGETPHRTHRARPDHCRSSRVAPCGTTAAMHRHRNHKEPLCELCAPVGLAYERDRKARRKTVAA